ncbi:MAG: HAD-IIIC family phosphatase [Bryobacteraceae bacterium]
MPQAGEQELDYLALMARSRRLSENGALPRARLAVLSDAATQQLAPLLKVLFRDCGLACDVYEGVFDGMEIEAHDAYSGLYKFEPDTIVLLHSVQAFVDRYYSRSGSGSEFLNAEAARIETIIDSLRARSSALLLLSNLALPYERFFGNYDLRVPDSLYSIVLEMNRRIVRCAAQRSGVLINDVEAVASWRGRRYWFDNRFWSLSKAFCALDQLPYVARNIIDIVLSAKGRSVKCIALDLDNTLWGGIVGDDGVEGIRISAHGDGEAYYRFQQYLLELKKRGILLAICSKNEFANAVAPFRRHPEMVIREDDITVFIANWNDKIENLKLIQRTLNIGFQSIVFIDDNPFERNLVRDLLPEVIVPEMPEDPADYVQAISELNLFETVSFSSEDTRRSELYASEGLRQAARGRFENVEEYLASLHMKLKIALFDEAHLPRITQLLQRSNQFNLTTNRYNEAQCRQMMRDNDCTPLYAELKDGFGDHGLISIVIVRFTSETAEITDWLMSCRVLGRGVEQELMNYVFDLARQRGALEVAGRYIPTPKNGMVRDFYSRFGFHIRYEPPSGETQFALAIEDYKPKSGYFTTQATVPEEARQTS